MKKIIFALLALAGLFLSACEDQSGKPYLKIVGGGFVFNYRYALYNYGFVAKPLRPLPAGATLEASFEVPDSDKKFVTTLPVQEGKMQYLFESQPLQGVKKDRPYMVKLRLIETSSGKELAMLEQEFHTAVDQSTLPTKAPVRGIGYFPAPQ
jgi:hypothetical protein